MSSNGISDFFIQNNVTTIGYSDQLYNMSTTIFDDYYLSTQEPFHPCYPHPNNTNFNCTKMEYLEYSQGPQTLAWYIVLSVTILFVGIFIAGIVGNVIVCIVIVRHSSMHTATNYYLFSLAMSDLIYLLFGLPNDLSLYWHQYPYVLGSTFCKLRALISEASTYVSVLTIVAFSMERFLAICHPLHLYTMSGFKRAIRIIAALWIISFLSAVPFGLYSKINYLVYPPDETIIEESAFCAMLHNPPGFPLWELSSLIFFVIPMTVMIVLYGRMGLQIRFRSRHTTALGVQQGSMHNDSKQSQSRKAIIRMLAAVVITFFVSWAPFHAQRLMYLYAQDWQHYNEVNTWLFSMSGLFYYFSCTINPILYNVMSHRYRVAFRETLCGRREGYYHGNGFCREAQSSVRESMISGTAGYENLVRIRSMRQSRHMNRDSKKSSSWGRQSLLKDNIEEEQISADRPTTDIVVSIGNNMNGRQKCYTTAQPGDSTTTNNIAGNCMTTIPSNINSNTTIVANSQTTSNLSTVDSLSEKDETCI